MEGDEAGNVQFPECGGDPLRWIASLICRTAYQAFIRRIPTPFSREITSAQHGQWHKASGLAPDCSGAQLRRKWTSGEARDPICNNRSTFSSGWHQSTGQQGPTPWNTTSCKNGRTATHALACGPNLLLSSCQNNEECKCKCDVPYWFETIQDTWKLQECKGKFLARTFLGVSDIFWQVWGTRGRHFRGSSGPGPPSVKPALLLGTPG